MEPDPRVKVKEREKVKAAAIPGGKDRAPQAVPVRGAVPVRAAVTGAGRARAPVVVVGVRKVAARVPEDAIVNRLIR
ncbi:MAG: hypothetical protein V2B19_25120 [Pseudomonadota bacterium]